MIENEKPHVNDGKGLWDNEGICDLLISDLNSLVKSVASGQYLQFCGKITEMVLKLNNLKKGIKTELDSKNEIIEQLKSMNNALVEEKTGLPAEKDGV